MIKIENQEFNLSSKFNHFKLEDSFPKLPATSFFESKDTFNDFVLQEDEQLIFDEQEEYVEADNDPVQCPMCD
jgi:hypothetical protein